MRERRKPLFERLMQGLEDGVAHARGKRQLKTTVVYAPSQKTYTGHEVAELRAKYGYSQSQFARVLGVSPKTLQSWEQGARKPSRPTMRLLHMLDDPDEFEQILAQRKKKAE